MEQKEKKYYIIDGRKLCYDGLHQELRKQNGNANRCDFCKTKKKTRFEWALKKLRQYSIDVNDYFQLCVPCHRKYDDGIKNLTNRLQKGHISSKRKKVILNDYEIFDSLTQAAKCKNITITSIANNLKGLSKYTKVGVWKYFN